MASRIIIVAHEKTQEQAQTLHETKNILTEQVIIQRKEREYIENRYEC